VPSPAIAVPVERAEGADSGFASIVEQYLQQSLEESEQKRRQARRLRGRMAMTASDHDCSVTLVFSKEGIAILDGPEEPLDATITGPYENLVDLIQGEDSPLRAHLGGRIKVRSRLRKLFFPLHVHNLMMLQEERPPSESPWFAGVVEVGLIGGAVVAGSAVLLYAN
jgi:putative sterol carrier protein